MFVICLVSASGFVFGEHVSKNGPEKVTFEVKNLLKFAAGGPLGALLKEIETGWAKKD
jgi:hypothetical protein